MFIPMEDREYQLLWKHTPHGNMQLKEANYFKLQQAPDLHWAKTIWSPDIPPAKSMLVWRLMHEKLPTDENLKLRGSSFPSMCSICCRSLESSIHIFFQCPFASIIWSWLSRTINLPLNFSSMEDIWNFCDLNWSPQCKVVIKAAIINLFNAIWFVRNQARFNDKRITCASTVALIKSNTSLLGNYTKKVANNSIRDFTILKHFNVNNHPPKQPEIKEIIWQPPPTSWIKCNIDGASKGNPGSLGCGGIVRNNRAKGFCCFAEPLGNVSSFTAELCAFMRAMIIARQHRWNNIWIETDSSLLLSATKHPDKVPWELRNRWFNSLILFRDMNCIISHIFREGNKVADELANHAVNLPSLSIWFDIPMFVRDSFLRNQSGLPAFRYCN
jgi:ribonuclease HI